MPRALQGPHLLEALSDAIEHRVNLRFRLAFALASGGLGVDEIFLAVSAS